MSGLNPQLEPGWKSVLQEEFQKDYMSFIKDFLLQKKLDGTRTYPDNKNIFRAFNLTPFDRVKVVILGQDPYHGHNQANGLCFSVNPGIRIPPSLRNIYKELKSDIGFEVPDHGDLTPWAKKSVLLLNSVLTVDAGKAGSHRMLNWESFTDTAISKLSSHPQKNNLVFIMWGGFAISKKDLIDEDRHLVITSPHPSPLSAHRGFFGSKPFSQANEYLIEKGVKPVDWALD